GPSGDLYVLIRLKEHARFKREGDDLVHVLRISPAQAALGDELEVPTIDGQRTTVRVPAGAQHGQAVRLEGKGIPRLRSSDAGELHLVKAYLVHDRVARIRVRRVRDALGHLQAFGLGPIGDLAVHEIKEEAWLETWKASFKPIRIGAFLVRPTWSDADPGDAVVLSLDPGMGFGTGLHPSTQACLRALPRIDLAGKPAAAIGSGSATLACARAKR